MSYKKVIALILTVAMVLSLAACGKENTTPTASTPTPTAGAQTTPGGDETPTPTPTQVPAEGVDLSLVKEADGTIFAGSVKTAKQSAGGGEVGYDISAGEAGKDYTDEKYYTYNDYIADTSTLNWDALNWETSDDSTMLSYMSSGYYDFKLNSKKDGWSVVCELAEALPVDVTKDYVGKYGIKDGETAKAWKIKLRSDLKWDDGTPINADTFIYSAKELLDPVMLNRRADSLYAGDFAIYNAKNYLYSGKASWDPLCPGKTPKYTLDQLVKGDDGVYTTPDGNKLAFGLKTAYDWNSGYTWADLVEMGYVPAAIWAAISSLAGADGFIPVTDESMAALYTFTGSDDWGNEAQTDLVQYMSYLTQNGITTWDEVGFFKTGDYEIVMVTINPTADPNYYVPYNLSSAYLVKPDLWEACKKFFNSEKKEVPKDSDDIVSVTTTYGTSVETSASFGPYKMTFFQADKQITFERNDQWYGYSDGNHKGQYQTDKISIQVLSKHETQLLAFLNGEVDGVGLQSDDMKSYGTSPYIRYTPQSYTTKLTFNTDPESLKTRGTQILANENFRHAYSLALDRAKFASSYTSAGTAGFGLLNKMYIYDPFSGASYRDTEGAMGALVGLYGLKFGGEEEYGDLEEAYDAITGYNINEAREYMKKAYDECIADKSYDGSSNVEIEMLVYQADDIYVQMFNFLNDALKEACKGTGFEGKVSLKMTVDSDYYNTMYSGNTDMIFSTWGGAASSPYTILYECYCDDPTGNGQQMEYGYDTSKVMVKINVDGVDYVESLQKWALWADNSDPDCVIKAADGTALAAFSDYDAMTKANIYGMLEKTYLGSFVTIPMYYRNSASLVSQKGDYPVTQYIDLINFGGLAYYTYKYTDEEWASVKGNLKY
ncbi:MAG: hypothetical protein J6Y20_11240 [Lachnospiraceae bacterium]|nr:hypothetical protein [Lachnospiraceae bacterium]